jgi:HPt (histidine-containing phosphotransfer) domain-containing protein
VPTHDLGSEAHLLEQLEAIREGFLLRTRGKLPFLRELLSRMQTGDSEGLAQLQSFAHRIHGTAATFDFAAISERAGQIDNLIELLVGTSAASVVEPHELRSLMECGRRLELEISAATTQGRRSDT